MTLGAGRNPSPFFVPQREERKIILLYYKNIKKKGEYIMHDFLSQLKPIREITCLIFGAIGSAITFIFGEWTEGMATLVILMVIDYITGCLVAAVFKNSLKTEGGGLKSSVGYQGLVKKFVELLIVACMYRVDLLLGLDYLRNLCILGFVLNEIISITENAGLMGIPLPAAVTKAIELLNSKSKDEGE
ncbi:phage holin family protein [Pseudobutyrivibrio sp.]